MNKKNKQQGAAIIVALFMVALIAAACVAMIQHFQIDMRRTELILQANQGYFYNQGAVTWAIDTLNKNEQQKKPDQVVDKTPIIAEPGQEGPYKITSEITDAQGLFNLNNLTDLDYQIIFLRLLQIISPETDQATAKGIIQGIVDWISPGLKETAYDAYYLKLNPPYRSAHQPLTSISELLLIKGMTPNLFTKLSPFITALPTSTPININNAPAPIIMSLSPSMTLDSAKRIAALLKQSPAANIQKLLMLDIIKNNPIPPEKLTTNSNYFLLKTNAKVGDEESILYTLLNRTAKDSQTQTLIIWQSKGTL